MTQLKSLMLLAVAIFGVVKATVDIEKMSVEEICSLLPANTSFLMPNTCSNWVKCGASTSEYEEGICADGLYYDKARGRCSYAMDLICPYIDTKTNSCENADSGVFLPDPSNCKGYIYCKEKSAQHGTCPNGLVFNPAAGACVYENDYTCTDAVAKATSKVCRALPNATYIAHVEECNKYQQCADGALVVHECPINQAYDHVKGRCVSIDKVSCYATAALPEPESIFCLDKNNEPVSGYFPDDESCEHYYVCAKTNNGKHDTNPKHNKCATGLYFDFERLSCRDRLNVKCSLDRCKGTNLTYVNVAGDCQSYARCFNETTVGRGKCPSQYYFDERTQGCTPQFQNYIACSE